MAALTTSAVDKLLGMLTMAIQDEARLIGGLHSDMKFIKDEMDSMNGFLLHLTKMEREQHDDQVRAWMKQVREVSYIAQDCVNRYLRDVPRHGGADWGGGCAGSLALFVRHPPTYFRLRKLAEQIAELKARVRDVGERRQRYGVTVLVPAGGGGVKTTVQTKLPDQDEEKRKDFVHALEKELDEDAVAVAAPSAGLGRLRDIIGQLPGDVVPSKADTVHSILEICSPPDHAGDGEAREFRCTKKMFLCALYVYPYDPTSQELEKLKEGVEAPGVGAEKARNQVMVFCYSMLSTQQKSCLQYLTAFGNESEISRTSMVRRWVAEELVGRTTTTPEESGERCFRELLLRGFIRAARWSDTGTVKSCVMDAPVRDFIFSITKSENFVMELPVHLERQLYIRSIVQPQPRRGSTSSSTTQLRRRNKMKFRRYHLCCCDCDHQDALEDDDTTKKDPIDEMVDYIKAFPELYRLNVLDLGGYTSLETRHLKSFADVDCLRYLSLRNTDISRLYANLINKLTLLETLDIRGTSIPPSDTKKIHLPNLKHLLAGRFTTTTLTATSGKSDAKTPSAEKASLVTVHMPDRIGSMRDMETLSHVQVSSDGAELRGVARLHKLRKLGVLVHANAKTAALLGRALNMLAECLRSLSVRVDVPRTATILHGGGTGILDASFMHEIASSLVLENLDIKGKMSLPSWIGRAPKLANVTLRDTEMDGGDALRRLSTVQSLRCLKLSREAFTEQALRFKDVPFQALKFLVIEGDAITQIAFFADDAAPKLEKIVWAIGAGSKIAQMHNNQDLIVGLQYLSSLKVIELRASFKRTNPSESTQQQTTSSPRTTNPPYCIRYISLSSNEYRLIDEVRRTDAATFSLPAGVIN